MSTNFVQPGEVIEVTAGGAVASGSVQVKGNMVGVAVTAAAASGDVYSLALSGVYTLAKDTALVISQGDRVFWDAGNSWVDKTATAQLCIGNAVADEVSAATTVKVRLNQSTNAGS